MQNDFNLRFGINYWEHKRKKKGGMGEREREILLGLKSCLWASALHSFYEYENIRCIIIVF